jgi:hypothetical protein
MRQEAKVEGPETVTFYIIDTESNTVIASGNPVTFPLKRGLILARYTNGVGAELMCNFTELDDDDALMLAAKIIREARRELEEEENPAIQFFEVQGYVDKLAYYIKIMRAFLAAHVGDEKLAKGVFWDEVENFYTSLKADVEAILERVHEIRKLEGDA